MDMDNLNTLDGIRNAFWSTMGVSADATGTHWVQPRSAFGFVDLFDLAVYRAEHA